jgi:hypothetical protein
MKAKVTRPFKGAKDGEVAVLSFKEGDTVEGELARTAIEMGVAVEVKKRKAPAPDHEKESSSQRQGRASPKKTATKRKKAAKK